MLFVMEHKELTGVYNCSAPNPVSNEILMKTFRKTTHTKIAVPSPARQMIRSAGPGFEWIAELSFTFGLVFSIITFVSDAMQVGSVLGKTGGIDPTTVGSGAEGAILLFGPIARLLTSVFLFTTAMAILGTHILPKWTARMAQIIAVFHFVLIPSIFSGTDPSYFYSINGLGIPISGTFLLIWILVVSIMILRKKN